MIKNIFVLLLVLFISGCSFQLSKPVQLGDDSIEEPVSPPLLKQYNNPVPQDAFMISENWKYKQYVTPGRYLFPNSKIGETFYLAHHASLITIYGNKRWAQRYRDYFYNNGVTADINIQYEKRQGLKIVYSHNIGIYNNEYDYEYTDSKSSIKADTAVAKIKD